MYKGKFGVYLSKYNSCGVSKVWDARPTDKQAFWEERIAASSSDRGNEIILKGLIRERVAKTLKLRRRHSDLIICTVCIFLVEIKKSLKGYESDGTEQLTVVHHTWCSWNKWHNVGQKRQGKRKRKWSEDEIQATLLLSISSYSVLWHVEEEETKRATKWRPGLITLNRPREVGQGLCWWRMSHFFLLSPFLARSFALLLWGCSYRRGWSG